MLIASEQLYLAFWNQPWCWWGSP